MSKPFDMELFLAAVLTGSHATRQRHLRQAMIIHAEISERWRLRIPWTWQRKHLAWFLDHCLAGRSEASKYRYLLTVRLIARRLKTAWIFKAAERVKLSNLKNQ
ncbi:hypothetical protein [Pseudomonas sp. JUb96]|uniref:hypothetical protein n=1 Tax=Pseudomonas sp. JUb96 TaxID=2940539 RepID=UPI002226EA60|nr:hypothetical protein [Pseudomonas sp. JUb96]MCW2269609.1 hypothetical protein [Pseudomonas sp. JUb96]